jgi:HlyD family secretion protein
MSPAPTAPRRWRSMLLWCLALVVTLGGFGGAAAVCQLQSESVPHANESIATAAASLGRRVHALGRLEPAGTVLRLSPPSGNEGARVERLMVREGEDVPAGSVVAVLDNAERRQAACAEAEARWHAAQARLEQIRAGAKAGDIAAQRFAVEVLAEQIKVARRELKRARDLHAKNVVTVEDLDAKQWAADRVELEHRRALELLKSISEVRETDVRVAEQEVATALAAVQRARADLAASEVRTPAAGRILKIHTRQGERIGDRGLLEVGDVLRMEAVAEIFEGDVFHIRPGLPAVVTVDSVADPLPGEVADVGHVVARKAVLSNDPVSDTDARVVEVRIRLRPADCERVARLSNARGEAQIELSAEECRPNP